MTLRLDVVTLGVPDVRAAHDFYSAVLVPVVTDHESFVDLDLHGAGHLGLLAADALSAEVGAASTAPGFRGFALSYVLAQPSEVSALESTAADLGAEVLKPVKKGFFGGFTGYLRAPDGAVWEPAAPTRKDTGPVSSPARPTEFGAILGVADPAVSARFYRALGMHPDRDYGSKFVGFAPGEGAARLALMPRAALAKDAHLAAEPVSDDAFNQLVLHHRAATRDEVDELLATAASAGGDVVIPAREAEFGGYVGYVRDLDDFIWKIGTAS